MGIQDKGAFGGFKNKTGPLVGRIVNGQNVITSIPRKSSKPPTEKQLDQRRKFGLVTRHLSWMRSLINQGFKEPDERQSSMNEALRYNLRYAVTGISPFFTINHAKMMFSQGKCPLPADIVVEGLEGAQVDFSWGISFLNDFGKTTDLVNLVVYNAQEDKFVILKDAASRSELGFTLQLPANFIGHTVHCYLNFVSETGNIASNSEYAGQLTVI